MSDSDDTYDSFDERDALFVLPQGDPIEGLRRRKSFWDNPALHAEIPVLKEVKVFFFIWFLPPISVVI